MAGETAGCQTLKGTGAEFNASCQGSLMWLSPPARAGIVKLSGAGEDAQTALRDALSLSQLWTQQGVGKHPPSSPRVCVLATWGCVHVRMCEFMLCWHFSAVSHCCYSWCYGSTWGFRDKMAPFTAPKNLCSGQGAADCSLIDLLFLNALRLSVWSNFKAVPSVCTYLCLPVSE